MARASAVKMPPEASAAHGSEGARRVLALMLAFSAEKNTLTARDLAAATGIALPSVYRYITLLRETGLLAGDERGSYRLSARLIGLARAAEAAESIIEFADPVMQELAARHRGDGHLGPADRPGRGVRAPGPVGAAAADRIRARRDAADRARRQRQAAAGRPDAAGPQGPAGPAGPARPRRPPPCSRRGSPGPRQQGFATSEEEIHQGVWAASAAVVQGKRTLAALTVPSPLVRAPERSASSCSTRSGPPPRGSTPNCAPRA